MQLLCRILHHRSRKIYTLYYTSRVGDELQPCQNLFGNLVMQHQILQITRKSITDFPFFFPTVVISSTCTHFQSYNCIISNSKSKFSNFNFHKLICSDIFLASLDFHTIYLQNGFSLFTLELKFTLEQLFFFIKIIFYYKCLINITTNNFAQIRNISFTTKKFNQCTKPFYTVES